MLAVAGSAVYAVNNQYIATNVPVAVTQDGSINSHWEPSTAAGGVWVHSYERLDISEAYTAAWNGTSWMNSPPVQAPCPSGPACKAIGDVYLSYDATRSKYLLVGTSLEPTNSSLYFATSPDGVTWSNLQEVLSGPQQGGAFDFGSIAVDSSGRLIVGSVKYTDTGNTINAQGFWISISYDGGASWSSPYQVAAPTSQDPRWGINSRVVGAGNQFCVFTPSLLPGPLFQPTSLSYYIENQGLWSGPNLIMTFSPPMNNSPNGTAPIYYAPLIDAAGSSSGTWAVTFQMMTGSNNNVVMCKNNPVGCYSVNAATDDEFMNGVSVDPLGGVWVSYLTYSSLSSRQLPLYHQTIYFPSAGGVLGVTGDFNVDPLSWTPMTSQDRCFPSACYAEGDYAHLGSRNTGSPGISAPYVNRSSSGNELFQLFEWDPQGTRPANTFAPNAVFHPIGTDLRGTGVPVPAESLGVAPEKRRKLPGHNQQ